MRAPTTGIYYQPRDSWKGQGETTFALGRIAVKDMNDLRTLAHETGHAFDFASRNARIPIPGAIMKEIEHRFAVPGSRGERNPALESRKREAWAWFPRPRGDGPTAMTTLTAPAPVLPPTRG